MTWKTGGQLVMEMVERLERKGLAEVAETAPSQVSVREDAGQTIDGGSRVIRNTVRACFSFVGHMKTGWTRLDPARGSRSIFSRDSARVRGGYAQPKLVVIVVHFGSHLRAAASIAHDGQRSGE